MDWLILAAVVAVGGWLWYRNSKQARAAVDALASQAETAVKNKKL